MFNANVSLICSLFCVLLNIFQSQSCSINFRNVQVSYIIDLGDNAAEKIINGCINSTTFEEHPQEIIIDGYERPKLTTLGRGAFNNLERLQRVTINYMQLQTIEADAFNNLPKLIHVNITDNKLTTFDPDIFDSSLRIRIRRLSLKDNKITSPGLAGFVSMVRLEYLDFRDNKLEHIDGNWFQNCYLLRTLRLDNNRIKKLKASDFKMLPILHELNLDGNDIKSIAPNTFHRLVQLKILSLRHNELRQLHDDTFGDEQFVLDSLYLSGNLLNFLSSSLMERLIVYDLLIYGNPLKCRCLEEVKVWLKGLGGKMLACGKEGVPQCVFPAAEDTCVKSFDRTMSRNFFKEAKNVEKDYQLCVNSNALDFL